MILSKASRTAKNGLHPLVPGLLDETLFPLTELCELVSPEKSYQTLRRYHYQGVDGPEGRVFLEAMGAPRVLHSSVEAWKRFLAAANGLPDDSNTDKT